MTPLGTDIVWIRSNITTTTATTSLLTVLFSSSGDYKAPRRHFRILDNDALLIRRAKPKLRAFYTCSMIDSVRNRTDNYTYFVEILDSKSHRLQKGSLSDWIRYRDTRIASLRSAVTGLRFEWTDWGPCLCGSFLYDTRHYRTGNCVVRRIVRNATVLLACQSTLLADFNLATSLAVENVSNFQQYKRCLDECVPDADESEELVFSKYRLKKMVQVVAGRSIALICPK